MKLALVIIPRVHRPQAEWIAKQLGLRIANGVPHVGSSKGWSHFPIDVPNLFTLENVPGHFVYQNRPDLEKKAYDFEDEAIAREVKATLLRITDTDLTDLETEKPGDPNRRA